MNKTTIKSNKKFIKNLNNINHIIISSPYDSCSFKYEKTGKNTWTRYYYCDISRDYYYDRKTLDNNMMVKWVNDWYKQELESDPQLLTMAIENDIIYITNI